MPGFRDSKNLRIALIMPHTDITSEFDLDLLFDDIFIHSQRIWLEEVTAKSERRMLDEELPKAVNCLKPVKPHAAVFGCTSAGALKGIEGDRYITSMIEKRLNCYAISAFGAVVDCISEIQPASLTVITPYVRELTDKIVSALSDIGFYVRDSIGMGKVKDSEISRITPEEITAFTSEYLRKVKKPEALFISCTNLRAVECKKILEQELDIPVVTSNYSIAKCLSERLGVSLKY